MKTLEKSQNKIQAICKIIREDTIKPAQEESAKIIQNAEKQAEQIIAEAKKQAEQRQEEAKAAIEQERTVFESSLAQAAKQSLEVLRQKIEQRFFKENLGALIEKASADPAVVAKLISTIIHAMEKEGLLADFTIEIPKQISTQQMNELLLNEAAKNLKENIKSGDFGGGVKVKLNNKNITLDLSNEAITALLTTHVARKDFRKLWFEN